MIEQLSNTRTQGKTLDTSNVLGALERVTRRLSGGLQLARLEKLARLLARPDLIHRKTQPRTQDAHAQTVRREKQQRQSEVSAGSQEGECDDGL